MHGCIRYHIDGIIVTRHLAAGLAALGNYSTSEVDTGFKWTDGKTIYKKSITPFTGPNNSTATQAHGISGMTRLIRYEGIADAGGGTFIDLKRVWSGTNYVDVVFTATSIQVSSNTNAIWTMYYTLFYTK